MNLERAYHVRGWKSAARLYNDIEYELALGEPSDRLETIGEHALTLLEERFPGVQEAARQIEQPPSLSRRASDALYGCCRTAPRPSAGRRRKRERRVLTRQAWSRLCAQADAHPRYAVATLVVLIVVIVNFWAYAVLGMTALAVSEHLRS